MTEPDAAGRPHYAPAIAITVSLFFLWGMANNLNDILIAQFKKAFILSDFGTSFVQQVFYLGYFLFAIPASLTMGARGYKAAIVTGLVLYGCGALLFYPAAMTGQYALFLLALFVIASGLAFLETSANPLMTELGDQAGAARRINWAQAANPLGAITGIWVGRNFILSGIQHDEATLSAMSTASRLAYYQMEVRAVATPYVAIGAVVFVFALAAALVRFPQGEGGAHAIGLRGMSGRRSGCGATPSATRRRTYPAWVSAPPPMRCSRRWCCSRSAAS
jgi:FHS family L-fucose permease-like MFS transporter